MKYITKEMLEVSLNNLRGTADHLLKIWFVLKEMGLDKNNSVGIDTSNSTPSLRKLFSYGDPEGGFFVPFAATERFLTMKADASRSIIQTTIKRWTEGSVVTVDPTKFLEILNKDGKLNVSTSRQYPNGLGYGKPGFSLEENTRIAIPDLSFALWLFKNQPIDEENPQSFLRKQLKQILNLNDVEYDLIFIEEKLDIDLQNSMLTDTDIYNICVKSMKGINKKQQTVIEESVNDYKRRIQRKMTITNEPSWLNYDAEELFKKIVESGEKSILIYGPPRTGKTRIIDTLFNRESKDRFSLQLHEGWSYENLIIGLQPIENSEEFEWKYGPLGQAILDKKKCIVLEEINRTRASQALGEIFSLIETKYRGEANKITLPNGDNFSIDEDTCFIFTMNTIDESTEDIDDALLGRLACIEFKPRIEHLNSILKDIGIDEDTINKIIDIYNFIIEHYPLGHGYFATYNNTMDFKMFYLTRIRPTLQNHFQASRIEILKQVDTMVDTIFI